MAHHSTVLAQFLKLVPRHEFESLAKRHHKGRKLRSMTRWNQFVAMSVAQLGTLQPARHRVEPVRAGPRALPPGRRGGGAVVAGVSWRLRSPMAWMLHRAVAHHAADVDALVHPVDGFEILAVGFPVPGQSGIDGLLRDVHHGLHHLREVAPILGLKGAKVTPQLPMTTDVTPW